MADCVVSESDKNVTDSSKQSSDVQSCSDVKTEKVMEPLLLEDFQRSKVPTTLTNLMKSFEIQGVTPSKSDFLVGCIYILMLEYGFIPQEKETSYDDCEFSYKRIKELSSFPGWKKVSENSFSRSFILAPHPLYVCKILCMKMGDDLIVNAIVKNIVEVQHTFMLDILSYFTDGAYSNADLNRVQNLKHFSTLFKSQVAFPVKHAILILNEVRHPCFEDLPLEIIFYIFKYFYGTDIANFTSTSKQFHSMRQDAKFWENVILREFDYAVPKNHSYDELMKEYGRLRRKQLQHYRRSKFKRAFVITH